MLYTRKHIIVTKVKLPRVFNTVHEIHERMYDFCLAYYFQKESKFPEKLSKPFLNMIRRGEKITLKRYQNDLMKQELISRKLDTWLQDYDVAITLTTGGEAMKGLDTVDRPDSCLIWTFCGTPAMSVPIFVGPTKLPFGLQVVAPKYHDYQLIKFVREMLLLP